LALKNRNNLSAPAPGSISQHLTDGMINRLEN
jgi:hypothetical protein